ncbi:MAG: DNA topoisomerase 3, partial [Myxococcaceae bacterium]|nr:DNA topoisomerase 3 [Myxococcaceae bacterium]
MVAEKPSVARDIAAVLGARARRDGFYEGNGYRVTWAIGHLVGLAEPHQIRPEWKTWRWSQLPMLPDRWPLVVLEKTRAQFEVVRRVLNDPDVHEVVCATDAGREGELIFRHLYEAAGCRKPVKRLWISSLTEEAIRDGFQKLKDAQAYDSLAAAAVGRSRADWLVGMNLSRAYGLQRDQPLSVGRVQTPTLAMVVERELAIRRFVPEDYLEVVATFSPGEGQTYDGTWFRDVKGERVQRLPIDGVEANAIVSRVKAGEAQVRSHDCETKRMPPPLLYDLTDLQRHANRLYGFSAQKTLELAQALYEQHKLLSYPRTSSRHLSTEVAATLPAIVRTVRGPYESLLSPGTGERPLSRRFVDDVKVTDHHALIPTAASPEGKRLSLDEQRIYDLVCRRFLAAWQGDFVWDATRVVTVVRSEGGVEDLFASSGSAIREKGWKALEVGPLRAPAAEKKKEEDPGEPEPPQQLLPEGLKRGLPVKVLDTKTMKKRTQPPRRFTDATLLTAMETAGRTLDEKELSDAMRECGLGTPATRAAMIETLLAREYIVRRGKTLEATEKGIELIAAVDPTVKSPVMTGQWEARLQRIERGEAELEPFLRGIEAYVREVIGRMSPPPPKVPRGDPRQRTLFDPSESERPSTDDRRARAWDPPGASRTTEHAPPAHHAPCPQRAGSESARSPQSTSQSGGSERITSQTSSSEFIGSQSGSSERTASRASGSQFIASQSAGSERITSQATGSRHAASESAAHERITSQTSSSQHATSESSALERVASQTSSSEFIGSQSGSSERTASQAASSHIIASQSAGSERITSQNASSQHAASESSALERFASQTSSSEFIGSKSGSSERTASQAPSSHI